MLYLHRFGLFCVAGLATTTITTDAETASNRLKLLQTAAPAVAENQAL